MSLVHWIVAGGAILIGISAIIFLIIGLRRNATHHQIKRKNRRSYSFPQQPIKNVDASFTPKLSFIEARLSPHHMFGLHFTVGALIFISSALLFAIIAENVLSGHSLTLIDTQIAQWLHAHNSPTVTFCLMILTNLHDPISISVMVALIAVYLICKKRWYAVLAVLMVVPGGMLLNLLMKQAFQRARPIFEQPLVMLTTYSFPSGHVAASTLFYGILAALLISQSHSWLRAAYIIQIAFAMVALVAFSRIYLGAHFLSDVLAAFSEAIAWLALCLTTIQTYRIYRETKKDNLFF